MKALSIKDPWGYLIAIGEKDVENRTWQTNFRGRILIHVSAKPDKGFKLPYKVDMPPERSLGAISEKMTQNHYTKI